MLGVDSRTEDELGGSIGPTADIRQTILVGLVDFGRPKIRNNKSLRVLMQQQIARSQITMHDMQVMKMAESIQHLVEIERHQPLLNCPLPDQPMQTARVDLHNQMQVLSIPLTAIVMIN